MNSFQQDETLADQELKSRIQAELNMASAARQKGNEGMARVCARRAAGLAAAETIRRRGLFPPGPSALDCLKYLRDFPDLPPGTQQVIDHLLMHITEDRTLPVDADLVGEAAWLIDQLLFS